MPPLHLHMSEVALLGPQPVMVKPVQLAMLMEGIGWQQPKTTL